MDDIVALRMSVENGPDHYVLSWGRLTDPVDPAGLEELVLQQAAHFSLPGRVTSVKLCDSLQEASRARYFYECFFQMCQKPIPFGHTYEEWRKATLAELRQGRELYFAGSDVGLV